MVRDLKDIPIEKDGGHPTFDWRQLRRWGVAGERAAGWPASFRFREVLGVGTLSNRNHCHS